MASARLIVAAIILCEISMSLRGIGANQRYRAGPDIVAASGGESGSDGGERR